MQCPKCNKAELEKGIKRIEQDGTEYFEFYCHECGERFADIKIPYSVIEDQMIEKEPEYLVELLIESGLNVDKKLSEEIKNKKEAIPLLIDILKTNKYWQKGEEGDAWAPLHALHLLSAMKAQEALPIILDILRYRPDDLGDWLTEEMGSILANFGEAAIPSLKEFIIDSRNDEYARGAATSALVVIYIREGKQNQELLRWFKGYLDYLIEKEDEFTTMFADDLLELKDPEIKGKIKAAFDRKLIDKNMFTLDDLEFFEEERELFHDKDPMNHFNRENINYLMEVNYPELVKVGRNKPCPCGSGKKYKLCCGKEKNKVT